MGRVAGAQGILMALALVLVASVSRSTPGPQVSETWAGLPPELLGRLHLNVAELPPFPEDHDALRDIRNWPKRRAFDGKPYRISDSESNGCVVYSVHDVQDILRGGEYTARRVVQYLYSRSVETSWISCSAPRVEIGNEWFDSTGNLVGFGLDDEYYWAGDRKTDGEFRRLTRAQDPWLARARASRTSPTE